MPRQADEKLRRAAEKFIDKFGFVEIDIDEFDMFIIDEGLADDPETDDPADLRFKGFVQKRTQVRNGLARGAKRLGERAFRIKVGKQKNDPYVIRPLPDASITDSRVALEMMREGNRNVVKRLGKERKLMAELEKMFPDMDGFKVAEQLTNMVKLATHRVVERSAADLDTIENGAAKVELMYAELKYQCAKRMDPEIARIMGLEAPKNKDDDEAA